MPRELIDPAAPELDELEAVLKKLAEAQHALLACIDARRDAMREADAFGLGRCLTRESEVVGEIGRLDERRQKVVGAIAAMIGSERGERTTFSEIASRVPGDRGVALRTMALSLRELMERVQRQNASARSAAEMLAAHMQGLSKQVAQTLNHAKTYGRRGTVDVGPAVISGVDATG